MSWAYRAQLVALFFNLCCFSAQSVVLLLKKTILHTNPRTFTIFYTDKQKSKEITHNSTEIITKQHDWVQIYSNICSDCADLPAYWLFSCKILAQLK